MKTKKPDKLIIEWTFSTDKCFIGTYYEKYMGKVFQSEVLYISDDKIPDYGVHTEYGIDLIPSNECRITNENK